MSISMCAFLSAGAPVCMCACISVHATQRVHVLTASEARLHMHKTLCTPCAHVRLLACRYVRACTHVQGPDFQYFFRRVADITPNWVKLQAACRAGGRSEVRNACSDVHQHAWCEYHHQARLFLVLALNMPCLREGQRDHSLDMIRHISLKQCWIAYTACTSTGVQ